MLVFIKFYCNTFCALSYILGKISYLDKILNTQFLFIKYKFYLQFKFTLHKYLIEIKHI